MRIKLPAEIRSLLLPVTYSRSKYRNQGVAAVNNPALGRARWHRQPLGKEDNVKGNQLETVAEGSHFVNRVSPSS